MKKNKLLGPLVISMLIALSLSMFSHIPGTMAAFGTSPPWVRSDHVLPGSAFEQVVYLSRNETEAVMQATVKITGDEELLKWIKIPDETDLIMKKGQSVLPMKVIVEVPESASLKNYTGGLFITLSPVKTDTALKGGEVGIELGAHVSVDLTVADDSITDYKIKSVSVEAEAEQDAPLSINVEVENTGNTKISKLAGQIDIYNSANTEIIKSLSFNPVDESVSPYETKEVKMLFQDLKLNPGEYWVAVKVSKDGEVVYEDRHLQKVEGEIVPVVASENVFAPNSQVPEMKNEAGTTLFTTLTDYWTDSYYLIFALVAFAVVLVLYIRHL